MKEYIFISCDLAGIGGAQRYVNNKMQYLVKEGWRVVVFNVSSEKSVLDWSMCDVLDIVELRCSPAAMLEKKRKIILKRMLNCVGCGGQLVVESSDVILALWGELLAKQLNGKHVVYLLGEFFNKLTTTENDFLRFKLARKEIALINFSLFDNLFRSFSYVPEDKRKVLAAYQDMPICSLDSGHCCSLPEGYDYYLGCISRLEKSYINPMLEAIKDFAENNSKKNFAMVFIGDTSNKIIKNHIQNFANFVVNLDIFILGFMSPIPEDLVTSFDVVIGKAGASFASASVGVPTITYAADKDVPIGLIGFDVSGGQCVQDACAKDLNVLLGDVLFLDKYKNKPFIYPIPDFRQQDFSNHIDFISFEECDQDYYDVLLVKPRFDRLLTTCWVEIFENTKYETMLTHLRRRTHKRYND